VFTDTSVTSSGAFGTPGLGSYWVGASSGTGSNVVSGTPQNVGGTAGSGVFVTGTAGTSGYKTMQNLPSFTGTGQYAGMAYLYLAFQTPPATTSSVAQLISFLLTAHP
jgi:hypothetical protein